MTTTKQTEHRGQIDSLVELAEALTIAREACEGRDSRALDGNAEDAEKAIQEDALEVCVRSGWVAQLDKETKPAEFMVLLATGGPAYRLVGNLEDGHPKSVRLEFQDWGIPWQTVQLTAKEESAALVYAGCFYFGE